MDDKRTLPRPVSGIPRLSRLPVPRTSSVRAAPSKDGLNSDFRASRLRPVASRDQLATQTTNKRVESLESARPVRNMSKTRPVPADSSVRDATPPKDQDLPKRSDESIPTALPPAADEVLIKRSMVLTRRPSEVFATTPLPASLQASMSPANCPNEDSGPNFDTIRAKSFRPRPSLSERTMETLSQLPSSPAMSKKSSTFFDPEGTMRPRSRAGSGNSRPGSSYTSDGSTRPASRPQSRPGSSSGLDDNTFPSFRASTNTYKTPLSTISDTPSKRTATIRSLNTPAARATPRLRPSASTTFASPSASNFGVDRSPSPTRTSEAVAPPNLGSRTVAARPLKSRASVNGLLRKPSLPAIQKTSMESTGLRKNSPLSTKSSTTSYDGTIPPRTSTSTTTAPDSNDAADASSRKSSSALRDQIAKAKAAKRAAAARQAAETAAQVESSAPAEVAASPIVPADAGFDFGIAVTHDPFNQRRSEQSKSKIIQQRLADGRTSGRLNISAMGLKKIPADVLKMYDSESVGKYDGSWAESVDLTRFVAADNELEVIDDSVFPDLTAEDFAQEEEASGNIFGGLDTLDLHGNLLISVPWGLRQLRLLTSLNLSSNRLNNNSLDAISQITSLRDLKLGNNLLYGPLDSCFSNLRELEILDLHGNNVSALPPGIDRLSRLRILNISDNSFEKLSFANLAKLPLTEFLAKKNKISGTLFDDSFDSLPHLQSLDVSCNQLTALVSPGSTISLPSLHQLALSMNRLLSLPDVSSWSNLLTLTADENSISSFPDGFTSLEKLKHVDLSSNDIRVVPTEIARMDNLAMIRLTGNPLRDKKFVTIGTEEMKEILAGRLEPPPPYQDVERSAQPIAPEILEEPKLVEITAAAIAMGVASPVAIDDPDQDSRSDMDDFATPPTSAPNSPARSRSQTLANQTWPVKQGGVLDRSNTQSSSLHPVVCSKVAADNKVREVQLHHNLFTTFPNSLTFFADTLSALSLAHNQLLGESYLTEELDLPALRELNLVSNHITSLVPLVTHLRAPLLEKIDVSLNRLASLPPNLRSAFPNLVVFLAANNHLADLDPDTIRGMKIVDAGNNDIARLNPRLGLLGGSGGLERLEVSGNRFRVPRWSVLERGTDATLRWLRGRVPVADMASWKEGQGDAANGSSDTSLADVD